MEKEGETSGENDKFEDEEEEPLVSIHAIAEATPHQTMRIKGNIKKKAIIILIDSRSTHNFLDVTVAKRTGCITARQTFNGCSGKWNQDC